MRVDRRNLPWIRYGLRTFLVVFTLTCLFAGYVSHNARSQRNAVEVLTSRGGTVEYDFERFLKLNPNAEPLSSSWPKWVVDAVGLDYFHKVVVVRFDSGDFMEAEDFAVLANLPDLEGIVIHHCDSMTDSELLHLRATRCLTFVSLNECAIKGDGLRHLAGNSQLRELDLDKCPVSDAGLKCVREFKNLDWLSLRRTSITDVGLSSLSGLTYLDYLNVAATGISNEGIEQLAALGKLAVLDVRDTSVDDNVVAQVVKLPALRDFAANISEDAVGEIRKALPNCFVTLPSPQ